MAFQKYVDRKEHDVLRQLISEWRTEAGLSQRELSAKLWRSSNYITKLEAGTIGIDVVELVDIIRVLKLDLAASFREYAMRLNKDK